jgi:predicted  nucleic acid-binding Zn-ribbon protein
MTDQQAQSMSEAGSAQEVSRIRDIIFGPQMRDYEQRFQTIQHDLGRLQQAIDRLAEQLVDQDSSQSKKLQGLRREMGQANDDLRKELREIAQKLTTDKVDRSSLGELFIELGTHLKAGGSLAEVLKGLVEIEVNQQSDRG